MVTAVHYPPGPKSKLPGGQMRLAPGHPVALKPLLTLRPKCGMRMILERRQAQ
jgi:hypothetical protein